jgi:hypothetical protein
MSKTQEARREVWRELIAKQQQSGCRCEPFVSGTEPANSFYHWRKRLAEDLPMKFALVATGPRAPAVVAAVEVMLVSDERLRIVPGVDAATLRLVLSVLREPR